MSPCEPPTYGYSDPRSGRVEAVRDSWPSQARLERHKGPEAGAFMPVPAPAGRSERGGGHVEPVSAQPLPYRRTSSDRLRIVRDQLSVRDQAVLSSLDQHPFLTTAQIQRLHFEAHATSESAARICRRVLKRLAELRLIEHLERRVGGVRAGSASFVWRIGPTGDRLRRQQQGNQPRARRKEPSLHHLEHSLAVAETHLRMLEAGADLRLRVLHIETEPTCWRPYLAPGAARAVLKPDLYAVTTGPGADPSYEDHWFIEVDRGTESLPTLLRKCDQYEQYRRSGREQQAIGVFPFVLWLLPDATRMGRLLDGIRGERRLDASLFRVATSDGLIVALTEVSS